MVQAPTDYDLDEALRKLRGSIDLDLQKGIKPNELISTFQKISGSETDRKSATDQTLKLVLQNRIAAGKAASEVVGVLSYGTSSARKGLCNIVTPFGLISDALDCSTLENCKTIFDFIEKHTAIWKSSQFYAQGKNNLLRACNDLLRRLSQSQNNVFCGRIHIFLTRIFPISEKSALNLNSNFNLENETKFEKFEIEENQEDNKENSDAKLYSSIWNVQDFFRNPNNIYETEKYKLFEQSINRVTDTFKNYQLENNEVRSETSGLSESGIGTGSNQKMEEEVQTHVYFPKFLTSSSLTELQLSDPSFRRQILTQILFLFQYLNGYVKFRQATNVLPFSQREWVKSKEKEVYSLLNQTPPNGEKYTKFIKHLLERENFWIKWKNEGCQKFMKEKEENICGPPAAKKRKNLFDDIINNRKLGLGSPELTKLWGKSESNLEACKTPKRQFIPSVDEYFEEGIMHSDPANEIEEAYKCYVEPSYGWRSLRLLAHSSPLFFSLQPATMHHLPVPKYLEHIFKKLRKEEQTKTTKGGEDESQDNKTVDAGNDDDNEFEAEKEEEAPATPVKDEKTDMLTSEEIDKLAKELGENWEELVAELRHIKATDIEKFKKESTDEEARARAALNTWQDKNGAEATKWIIRETLHAIGLEKVATAALGEEPEEKMES
jgi:THO complex subunit 1